MRAGPAWALVSGPAGMTIDSRTGEIFWLPPDSLASTIIPVTVRVTDCHGASSEFSFGIELNPQPDAPVITSRPVVGGRFGHEYVYDVEARDRDLGDVLEYILVAGPPAMTIEAGSGVIRWSPTASDGGAHGVIVIVRDSFGLLSDPQAYTLNIAGDPNPPEVTVTVTPPALRVGETATIRVTAFDEDDAFIEGATVDGTPITLDATGTGTYVPSAPGVLPVVATAIDPSGNRGTGTAQLRVLIDGDDVAPVVTLETPAEDEELTYLHDATGTVFDDNLYVWTLDARRTDRGGWIELARGTNNIPTPALVGVVDTTLLENGLYVLRLRAEDVNGQVGEAQRHVRITGGAKLGHVRFEVLDMVVPAMGIPLSVVRRYDSRTVHRVGDFGHGWELDVRQGQIQHNRPLGDGWTVYSDRFNPNKCQRVIEWEYHFTEVRLSDDEWYLFRPSLQGLQQASGRCQGVMEWEQVDGTRGGAVLAPLAGPGATFFTFGPQVWPGELPPPFPLHDLEDELIDPDRFRLTLPDGRSFVMSTAQGIERMQDADGFTVSIDQYGIHSTAGRDISFVRDARGRILQMIDDTGRSVGYRYDALGNLVAFTDLVGRDTTYEYEVPSHPHHLTSIIDDRGVRIAALDYQADGRLAGACDADGVCSGQSYDLPARQMRITDGIGVPTRYTYDRQGNVQDVIDGLGNVTSYSHIGSLLTGVTDPTGARTSYDYARWVFGLTDLMILDQQPHVEGVEDPTHFATTYSYDTSWNRVTETLPTGGTLHYAYDDEHHLLTTTDDDGRVILSRTYDDLGNVATYTDRFGTTTFEYGPQGAGRPTTITDPQGQVTTLTYDEGGNVLTATRGALTMTYRYDAQGRRLFADYGRGVTVSYEYAGPTDEWTAIEGPTFGRVTRRFSSGGRLLSSTMPNGDTTTRVYDALGRVRVETAPNGAVTRYHYDAAGRLERLEDESRGVSTSYEHDAAGRVTATTDHLGHRTESPRDIRGGMAAYEDATGRRWEMTDTGRSSISTDPLGNVTTSTRREYGLPGATTYPGGASTDVSFLGQTSTDSSGDYPLSRIDELGRSRQYTYDAGGALTTATDLGGTDAWAYDYVPVVGGDIRFDVGSGRVWLEASAAEPEVYGYRARDPERDGDTPEELDAAGHALRSVTSPEGEVTTRSYDARGHIDTIEYPTGGVETRSYDASTGYEDTRTLAHGTTLSYVRDAAGRELERSGTDGSLRTTTYGPSDRMETLTDATGTTTYGYDAPGRWTGLTYPTGGTWERAHDAADRVTSVTTTAPGAVTPHETQYLYDDANRLTRVIDPLGGETSYTYDAAGRMQTRTLPNGVVTTWTYDVRSRVDTITHRRADATVIASVDYQRTDSGEPTRIDREDGSYVLLGYDAALRLTSEAYHDATDTLVETIAYSYDRDGNRTSRTTAAGEETYAYASGSRLTGITRGGTDLATYTYDAAGRVTTRRYDTRDQTLSWDADDHVVALTEGTTELAYDFDAAGRRVRREERIAGTVVDVDRWQVAPSGVDELESPHLQTDDTGAEQRAWVFAGEHPLLRYDPATGDVVYYLSDAMGSVIGLVDDAGAVGTVQYDGFGSERVVRGAIATVADEGDFRFQGMWLDGDSGLYYVRARVYETQSGRFLSRDPAEGVRTGADTYWTYAFAADNPWVFADPTGRFATTVSEVTAGVNVQAIVANIAIAVARELFRAVVARFAEQLLGSTRFGVSRLTTDIHAACAALGLSTVECRGAIHGIKAGMGLGPADNVVIDDATGDVYDAVTGDYLGNLVDEARDTHDDRDRRRRRRGRRG